MLTKEPLTISIIRTLIDQVEPIDTMHIKTNTRIDIKNGADTALLTAYALTQHCPLGKRKDSEGARCREVFGGGDYQIDLVRDEGELVVED